MRVLFLGMRGAASLAPLDALLAAGHDVCAALLPAPRAAPLAIRLVAPPSAGLIALDGPSGAGDIAARAWERGAPVYELARPAAREALDTIAALRPDIACVACWPRRIPPALLRLPAHGFLNIHSSLLPAYRGPEPLFWTLRDGAPAGVTVHLMDESLDTGPIVAQAPVELPPGAAMSEAELRCNTAGGALLVDALGRLAAADLRPAPQPPGGSAQGFPTASDFAIEAGWGARRAFSFMRGAAEWGVPFTLSAGGERLRLAEALAYELGASLGAPYLRDGSALRVQLADGVLVAREALGR